MADPRALKLLDGLTLNGDPSDVSTTKRALREWVNASTPAAREDAQGELSEVFRYVIEFDENHAPLVATLLGLLALDPARDPAGLLYRVNSVCERGEVRLLEVVRDQLAPLASRISPRELARVAVTLFQRTSASAPWTAFLERAVRDSDEATRATALIALAFAAPKSRAVTELFDGTLPTEAGLEAAAAFVLRHARRPLSGAALELADRAGEPGSLERILCRDLELSLDLEALLPPFSEVTPRGELEAAKVIFSGASLVMVQHPTRGNFTLRVSGAGLTSGDTVLIGDFLSDRAQRARWTANGSTREARFDLQGDFTGWVT